MSKKTKTWIGILSFVCVCLLTVVFLPKITTAVEPAVEVKGTKEKSIVTVNYTGGIFTGEISVVCYDSEWNQDAEDLVGNVHSIVYMNQESITSKEGTFSFKINEEPNAEDTYYLVIDSETLTEPKVIPFTFSGDIYGNDNEEFKLPFVDVTKEDWFYGSVEYTFKESIMTGMDDTHFGPYGQLSRAQFALILYRMEGSPDFSTNKSFNDIAGDEWYGQAVLWAAENNIVTGYVGGNFGPTDNITREQMAVMMYRYATYLKQDVSADVDLNTFVDGGSVSSFATDAIKWANANGIITGKENGTMIDPQGNTARAEAAAIIQRFMD